MLRRCHADACDLHARPGSNGRPKILIFTSLAGCLLPAVRQITSPQLPSIVSTILRGIVIISHWAEGGRAETHDQSFVCAFGMCRGLLRRDWLHAVAVSERTT